MVSQPKAPEGRGEFIRIDGRREKELNLVDLCSLASGMMEIWAGSGTVALVFT